MSWDKISKGSMVRFVELSTSNVNYGKACGPVREDDDGRSVTVAPHTQDNIRIARKRFDIRDSTHAIIEVSGPKKKRVAKK